MLNKFDLLNEKKLNEAEKIEIYDYLFSSPIINVNEGFIKAKNNKEAKKKAIEWMEKFGDKIIYRDDIGDVVFSRSGVKSSFEHRIYQNKLDALPAIPIVIEKGKVIDISNDFDGKPIKNTLITAPIQIGNKQKIMVIRLRMVKGQDNKYYLHDILIIKDLIKNKSNAIKAGSTGKPVGESSKSIAHIYNIVQDILSVKNNQ